MADCALFVHLGDLHLGPGPRNVDRLAALDHVINENIRRPDLAAWLWPGDLNHGRMTIEDRNGLAVRIQMMASVAPVVIVIGNHDVPGDLNVLERLARTWQIVVVTSPQVVELDLAPSRTLRAAIACIPYPSKALLVAAGTPHDRFHAAAAAALDTIFMDLAAQLAEARAAGRLTLAIGHVMIGSAVASVGQPQIGTELEIDEGHLARLGDCYKGFNHVHKHQRVGSAWYAGSLCRLDFSETEPKGYLVIKYEAAA